MKMRTWLLAGLTAACLGPAAHPAESPKQAQIKAVISASRQKSSGPFAGFASVYDILKSCRPLEHPDAGLGTMWLLAKSVIWFEGDDILFVKFLAPGNVERGTLKFKQDYSVARDRTVKLYDLIWKAGDTDIVAFLPDRQLFDGKFARGKYSFNYARRCDNEDQIIEGTGEILRLMGL